LCCAVLLAWPAHPKADQQQRAVAPQAAGVQQIHVTAGRSVVLTAGFDVTRIAVTNPAVADATVVQAREVLIDGKAPGTISLILWGANERVQYDLVIEPGVPPLQQQLQALFPGEDINVGFNDEALVLSGHVSSNQVSLRAGEVAQAVSSKLKVINLLQLPGSAESQQVLLQVRFAEVNRQAMTELGASWFTSPTGIGNTIGRITTGQFAAPGFTDLQYTKADSSPGSSVTGASGKFSFSDFLNLFLFSEKYDIGAVVQLLKTKGYLQSLAEPNLIAYNGQEASFLAGGEFPIPVVQGLSNAVTVQFKEFGVRLTFKPTIAGDTIRLKVRPEVSSLDFANGISLSGFRIPALTTRRAETDVELRDGQSFAIAGLLNNISQDDSQAIPVLGSLPIIGPLFRSKAETKQRTELMVLITPRLVRPLNPDEVPRLPNDMKRFLPAADGLVQELSGGGGAVDAPDSQKSPAKSKSK
jgi:pilus assembly protein CpaC